MRREHMADETFGRIFESHSQDLPLGAYRSDSLTFQLGGFLSSSLSDECQGHRVFCLWTRRPRKNRLLNQFDGIEPGLLEGKINGMISLRIGLRNLYSPITGVKSIMILHGLYVGKSE